MKISLNWLKTYVPIVVPAERAAEALTMAGLEVEKMISVGNDTIFELEITPNRPDCLNYLGIAREVSAIFNKSLKPPKILPLKPVREKANVVIDDEKACPRYIGTLMKDVLIKESPSWLTKNLDAIGSRAINNVVDITNFCLMEWGQPLHAFDYDKLIGGKIIVRRAKAGETIVTIDGVERKLDPSLLVIADEKRPVAIAGIMGGKDTEVTEKTKNILLESAYFDPVLIRLASRKLGLTSDSAYRFERGVIYDNVERGSLRAIALIKEEAGASVQAFVDLKTKQTSAKKKPITINLLDVERFLGTPISANHGKTILNKLGFGVVLKKDVLKVLPPSFRNDIQEQVDVIEELARIFGYDRLSGTLPQVKVSVIPSSKNRYFRRKVSRGLTGLGLNEVITYAMTNTKSLEKCLLRPPQIVRVKNPLSQDQELMRPSLLPSLLTIVQSNLNRGQKDLRFFETGKIYSLNGEKETLGIIMTGQASEDWRQTAKPEVNFYDLKGVLERIFETMHLDSIIFSPYQDRSLTPGQAAAIVIDGQTVGFLGKLSAEVLKNWDIRSKGVFFAQIDLETLAKYDQGHGCYKPVGEYPAVVRDVSLAVKKEISFEEIRRLVQSGAADFLRSIDFVEEYLGDKIPAGHRGVTFSLVYQSSERTLREEEVAQTHDKICQLLLDRLGAIRR